MIRRSGSTVLLTLFALLLGTEPLMLRAADKNPVEPGAVDKDAPEEFTTTKSGLKYRIRRQGKGQKPEAQDTVSVHYKGWFDNGKEFDSSYARGESIEFPLKGVIAGWTEGMQLVGKGGMIELEVPYELGYGEKGRSGIPGKARLHFLVELMDVTEGPKPVEPGLVDKDAPEEFTTTPSGLKYRIRRQGKGKKPTARDKVSVHYKGWLDNGQEFDSSYARGESISFALNRVIPGWSEGMQLVGQGGMIELEVPYELGYGEEGTQGIPGKATLHFLVELLPPPAPGLTDKDAPKEFTATKSGLKYRILRKSDGAKPKASNTVTVHYKGTLDDGTQFDSSYDRGQPATFPLGGVIPGWTEGMQLIGKGGMIELEIPYQLAYGEEGRPPTIPAKAQLRFIVELLEVK